MIFKYLNTIFLSLIYLNYQFFLSNSVSNIIIFEYSLINYLQNLINLKKKIYIFFIILDINYNKIFFILFKSIVIPF